MTGIEHYQLKDGQRLRIEIDESGIDPRDGHCKDFICIKGDHRHNRPNELLFDFDKENIREIKKDYWVFKLDVYEHSGVVFHLSGEWCPRGRENVGFIAMDRKEFVKQDEAKKAARSIIEERNAYINGEIYRYTIEKPKIRTSEDGDKMTTWEFVESCGWFTNIEDIKKDLYPLFLDTCTTSS